MRNTFGIVRRNPNGSDRIALNRREQDAPERIADRRPESRFKRVRRKLSVIRIRFERSVSNAFRFFKTFEQIFASHLNSLHTACFARAASVMGNRRNVGNRFYFESHAAD